MSASRIERVTTPRLVLERLQPGHADELLPLMLHPQVAATLWPRPEPPTAWLNIRAASRRRSSSAAARFRWFISEIVSTTFG